MPKTPEGKKRASQNACKHGLRSKSLLVLPGESEAAYEATRKGWTENYEPEGYHEMRLVEQLILNDWLLQRANRRMLEAEAAPVDEHYEHRLALMQRYKTSAERAFYRALGAMEALRKDRRYDELTLLRLTTMFERENARLRRQLGVKPGEMPEEDGGSEPKLEAIEDLRQPRKRPPS